MTAPVHGNERQSMAGFSASKRKALAALAVSPSVTQAAKKCGLGERTIHRYLTEEGFRQALEVMQSRATADTLATLEHALSAAVEALRGLLVDSPPGVTRAAAADLLRFGLQSVEMREITKRLDEMERRLSE